MASNHYGANTNYGIGDTGHHHKPKPKPRKPVKPRAPKKPDLAHTPGTPEFKHLHPYLTAAQNDAKLQYGPVDASLNARGAAIPSWFQNYRNQLAQQQTASQQYAAPIVQQAQQNASQAGQVAPGVDPNSQAGQDAQLAAAARAALGNSFVSLLQGMGQAQNNYLTGRQTVASTAELGAQQQLATDRTNVAKEKGSYIASQRAKHKDEHRQQVLENQAFGLKVADTAADNARQDKQQRQQRQDKNNTVNKYGYTNKDWQKLSTPQRQKIIRSFDQKAGTEGGKNPFTPLQRQKTKTDIRKGVAAIQRSLSGKKYAPEGFWDKAYLDLLDGGYDPLLARAVIQIGRYGKVGKNIAGRVKKNYGVTSLPRGKPIAVPKPYVANPAPQADSGPLAPGQQRPT